MDDSEKPLDPKHEALLKTRGIGSGKHYEPFIKVHEISSTGESFRILGRHTSRPHHLLSRLELSAFLLFDRYIDTVDIKEQYPIPIADSLSICSRLGIRHPQTSGRLKVVTTDLVIELSNSSTLAIAVKPSEALDDLRVIEKLQIEKVYWEQRNCEWKVFTEREFTPEIKENFEWLHASHLNVDNQYSELSYEDVKVVFQRISGKELRLSTVCAALDDDYGCQKGFHIGVIRWAVATNLMDAPLNIVFKKWACNDLCLLDEEAHLVGGVLDVS
jgi:hypothetical protein